MRALRRVSLVLVALVVASCGATGSAGSAASPAPSVASLAPSPVATAMPAASARLIAGVGGRAQVSPDGKWIALTPPQPGGKGSPPWVPTIELHDIDGKLVRSVEVPTPNWTWMPDSSGIFVALDAPQRPASLGVLDITGTAPRATGLLMADQQLSRDNRWIIAEHAEGCCAQVTYPAIRIAPRGGGDAKVLVQASDAPGTALILGIDASDRLVYRDGVRVLRLPIAGGTPQLLGTLPQKTVLTGNSSPDGSVTLMRGYEPLGWYVIANDRVTPWDDRTGAIVEDLRGERLLFGTRALWIGGHTLLIRSPSGGLSSFDALAGLAIATKANVRVDDIALAYEGGRLLVGRATRAVVIDLAGGRESDLGLDFGPQADGARAWFGASLPTGGFVLSTLTATYRID